MKKWFRDAEEDSLWCYSPPEALRRALDNPKVVDALLLRCGAVGRPEVLKKMDVEDKLDTISTALTAQKRMKGMFHGVDELEQLAFHMFGLDIPVTVKNAIWPKVKQEADLLKPVSKYFEGDGFEVYKEIPMGKARVDLLARKKAGWFSAERLIGVELKNDLVQLKRGLDQMTTFADYTHQIYLACTPALAVEYLNSHVTGRGVKTWDGDVLDEKLKRAGIGLLLVRGTEVVEVIEAEHTEIREQKIKEITPYLVPKNMV
jgi:hypothetical protein